MQIPEIEKRALQGSRASGRRPRSHPPQCHGRFRPPLSPTAFGRAKGANSCGGQCYGPSARARRANCGCAAAFRPRRKNVACTHSLLRASRILGVVPGQGPSSNVSTNSLARSGSVEGKCLRPTRGVSLALTSRTRSVPSASGFPGQGAAAAVQGAMARAIATRSVRVMKDSMPHQSLTGKLASNLFTG